MVTVRDASVYLGFNIMMGILGFFFFNLILWIVIITGIINVFYYFYDRYQYPMRCFILEPRQGAGIVVRKARAGRRKSPETGFEYIEYKGYPKHHNKTKPMRYELLLQYNNGDMGFFWHPNRSDFYPMKVEAGDIIAINEDMKIVHQQVIDTIYKQYPDDNLLYKLLPLISVGIVAAFIIIVMIILPSFMESFLEGPIGELAGSVNELGGIVDRLNAGLGGVSGTSPPVDAPN